MVDNVDSFVWNLVRYLALAGAAVEVCRNDQLDFARISRAGYSGIVLSPGPGNPDEAGSILQLIRHFQGRLPIFGVCLGHQAIAQALGGRIIQARQPLHGKLSRVRHNGLGVFCGLPSPLTVTHYHSLIVDPATLPPELLVSCRDEDGTIMGLQHESGLLESVQFHPEAELTEHGLDMIRNFVVTAASRKGNHAAGC
jgi:para-aminobenzoate synthetase component II